MSAPATVVSVNKSPSHRFSKAPALAIRLVAGLGVAGDAHAGATVKHRSRIVVNPEQPNLRQVHLIQWELLETLQAQQFAVQPGILGENITTQHLDLLDLPQETRLLIGNSALVEVTGLRNPCVQLDRYQSGLMAAVLERDDQGKLIRKAGIMGIVLESGDVYPGDSIQVLLPAQPHLPLQPV